jgi:cell division protein FtsZ
MSQLGYQSAPQLPGFRPAQPNAVHSEYAKRPAAAGPAQRQQPLDQHGRPSQPARQSEDDQLEIPAFLRRQTS